jgi:hypothetical protein
MNGDNTTGNTDMLYPPSRKPRTQSDRIHALRDAVQSIIGAEPEDIIEAFSDTDSVLAAAVTKLREAGQ